MWLVLSATLKFEVISTVILPLTVEVSIRFFMQLSMAVTVQKVILLLRCSACCSRLRRRCRRRSKSRKSRFCVGRVVTRSWRTQTPKKKILTYIFLSNLSLLESLFRPQAAQVSSFFSFHIISPCWGTSIKDAPPIELALPRPSPISD